MAVEEAHHQGHRASAGWGLLVLLRAGASVLSLGYRRESTRAFLCPPAGKTSLEALLRRCLDASTL